jgi:hypothetical protein
MFENSEKNAIATHLESLMKLIPRYKDQEILQTFGYLGDYESEFEK